jgi:hypothetical protein
MRWRGRVDLTAAAVSFGIGLAAMMAQTATAGPTAPGVGATDAPTEVSAQQRRPHLPRITVYPLSRYYRKCDFWLAVEHRLSGDVITPQQHCWWALR